MVYCCFSNYFLSPWPFPVGHCLLKVSASPTSASMPQENVPFLERLGVHFKPKGFERGAKRQTLVTLLGVLQSQKVKQSLTSKVQPSSFSSASGGPFEGNDSLATPKLISPAFQNTTW